MGEGGGKALVTWCTSYADNEISGFCGLWKKEQGVSADTAANEIFVTERGPKCSVWIHFPTALRAAFGVVLAPLGRPSDITALYFLGVVCPYLSPLMHRAYDPFDECGPAVD